MPTGINQPANQIKLTNVSLVRYKKGKKRFELACYKNKLLEYRSGTETDLDNVLQVPTVFLSVSKGATAPAADLAKSFGAKTSTEAIIEEILQRGEIQVGAGERKELLERIEREVLELVAGRVVDPGSKRVYTTGMIKKALEVLSSQGGHAPAKDSLQEKLGRLNLGSEQQQQGRGGGGGGGGAALPEGRNVLGEAASPLASSTGGDGTPTTTADADAHESSAKGKTSTSNKRGDNAIPMWTGVVTSKTPKSQALDAIKALIAWQPIPLMRARMRLRVSCPTSIAKQPAKSKIPAAAAAALQTEDDGDPIQIPSTQGHSKGGGGGGGGGGTIKDRILAFVEQVDTQDTTGDEWEVIGFVEPGVFKGLGEFVAAETKGRGRVEVLDVAVTHED